MRPLGSVESFVIIACVVLAALCACACAFDQDGDGGVAARLVDNVSPSPCEGSRAAPVEGRGRPTTRPRAKTGERLALPGLLAAVPGGLCLLI